MNGENKGGFGGDRGGPRKPKPTFGDVMLGIPSGRKGQRDEPRQGRGRDDRPPRRSEADRSGDRPPRRTEADRGADRPKREPQPRPPRQEKPSRPEPLPALPPLSPQETAPKQEAAASPAADHRNRRRDKEGGRAKGPLVVVRRAPGVISTRTLEEPESAPSVVPKEKPTVESPEPVAVEVAAEQQPPKASVADDVSESHSFAELFEESAKHEGAAKRPHRIGEKVSGKIFQLGADTAFVSLGGRSEALIELRELTDDEGILRYGVGDTIEAHVIEVGAKGVVLSRALAKGSANIARLAEARASGMPVEGLVLAVNKGGLEVAVGDVRAFCPVSQIDLRFVEKPDRFVGEKLVFKVTEVRDRNVVLSRRAILEEEQKTKAAETRKTLSEGKVVRGQVISVREFGAFVDLGGIEGLIPTSELSHSRIGHPSEVVKVGDELEVEVLKMDPANPNSPDKSKHKERISLSLRARQEDPWKLAMAELKEGGRATGKVVRLQPFGAFVELRPGVDGLIHISALSDRRIAHPKDVVSVGQQVDVEIEKIDPNEKRIGLRLVRPEEAPRAEKETKPAAAAAEPVAKPKVGQLVTGTVDRIEPYGIFVKFAGGRGLVPASETGTERGSDLKRHFQLGKEIKSSIVEIDGSGKIRLSITDAAKAEERADTEAWVQKQGGQTKGKGFGTFGDLLRGKKII